MDIKPVRNTCKPGYPRKEEVNQDVLKESVPGRWAASAAAKVALGTLAAMTLAGCVPDIPLAGVTVPPSTKTEESVTPTMLETALPGVPLVDTISVAPLFLHGEGRAAYGGDMASMPAFISEDEALSIINEAAKDYGLEFMSGQSPVFTGVLQPSTNIYNAKDKELSNRTIDIKADFFDSEHGVVIEYVSVDDVEKWSGNSKPVSLNVEYDTQDAAEQLSEGFEQAQSGGFYTAGVLYDPCEHLNDEDEARELSRQHIKEQATDFFEWLKQQGII